MTKYTVELNEHEMEVARLALISYEYNLNTLRKYNIGNVDFYTYDVKLFECELLQRRIQQIKDSVK